VGETFAAWPLQHFVDACFCLRYHESVAAIRSLGWNPMIRRALLFLVLLACPAWADDPPPREFKKPVLIRVEGVIDSWLEHYVLRKLTRAKQVGCDLLILEIDSPGGGLNETLKLCEEITGLSGVHTVAYIPHQALSGAALLSLACDDIVMGEYAQIGDCGPIFMDEDFMFRHAPEKIASHLISEVRALCERKKHPPALGEAMVDRNVKVERLKLPDGSEQFLTDRELPARPEAAGWQKLETLPESGGNRFFEVAGRRAVDLRLASATVERRDDLFQRYGLKDKPLVLASDSVDTTAYILNMWLVTALLLIIGLVGIAYELSAPGVCIGGLTAALCFALFFWSRFLGGTSGWLEVVLFASGIAFLAMEVFVIPGFGITGITGLALMIAGIVLASQNFTLPTTNSELARMTAGTLTTSLSGIGCLVVCALMVRHMHSIPVLNRLMLKPPSVEPAQPALVDKDGKPLPPPEPVLSIGDWGVATTMLRPGGKARFGDYQFDVVADGAFIQPGIQVRVIEQQGTRIVVEAAT
jgi:membrane-bound serine protease (ClpP class)